MFAVPMRTTKLSSKSVRPGRKGVNASPPSARPLNFKKSLRDIEFMDAIVLYILIVVAAVVIVAAIIVSVVVIRIVSARIIVGVVIPTRIISVRVA